MFQHIDILQILELPHMDLIGPIQVKSFSGKKYMFVCVDDFSRYTWVDFLRQKSDTFHVFKKLCARLKTEKNSEISQIVRIRSDYGKEFENTIFADYCDKYSITHEFSAPKTT